MPSNLFQNGIHVRTMIILLCNSPVVILCMDAIRNIFVNNIDTLSHSVPSWSHRRETKQILILFPHD